jgi:hypothetical protein
MKIRSAACVTLLFLSAAVAVAQDKAGVQMEKPDPIRVGGPIAFKVKLNEPMPKGAHFDFRISPVAVDEEVSLGPGEPVNGSDTEYRVSGTLPDTAVAGEWHISVIWLFLPGAGWTHNSISPNDLRFQVEGKTYPIPTSANVTLAH